MGFTAFHFVAVYLTSDKWNDEKRNFVLFNTLACETRSWFTDHCLSDETVGKSQGNQGFPAFFVFCSFLALYQLVFPANCIFAALVIKPIHYVPVPAAEIKEIEGVGEVSFCCRK